MNHYARFTSNLNCSRSRCPLEFQVGWSATKPKTWALRTMEYQFAALPTCLVLVCTAVAMAQEDPKSIVATAVRQNGYECNEPQSVKPDPNHTAPDEKAWIIHCENATYQVKFMGDRGAEVELISE